MVDIIVQRGAGTRQGDDIVDPLVSALPAAIARGRAELDTHSEGQQPVTLLVMYRPGLRLGQLVEVQDSLQGRTYRGKISDISYRMANSEVVVSLSLMKGAEVF